MLPPLAAVAVPAPFAYTLVAESILKVCSNVEPLPPLPLMVIQSEPSAFTTPSDRFVASACAGEDATCGTALIVVAWRLPGAPV